MIPILRALASILDSYGIDVATSGAGALARLATLPAVDVVLCGLDDLDVRDPCCQACALSLDLRLQLRLHDG